MLMGKNPKTKRYETIAQLLILSAAVLLLTPFFASNLMDLELISVSKTMLLTLYSSIKPWLYPPYIYLLINFIIFFIFASSFINNTRLSNPTNQSDEESKVHKLPEDMFEDVIINDDFQFDHKHEDMFNNNNNKDIGDDHVVPEISVVDKRELRKSKTFHEGRSRPMIGRRERYVKILSQEELDRRVEAFIYRFKKDKKVQ